MLCGSCNQHACMFHRVSQCGLEFRPLDIERRGPPWGAAGSGYTLRTGRGYKRREERSGRGESVLREAEQGDRADWPCGGSGDGMLAASRSGAHEPPRIRRHSVASLGSSRAQRNAQENNRENRSNSIAQQRARKIILIRELETNWYLKTCGLSREETTAHQTGMPYR
ncbi:hypothetical protein SKAU_G00080170 [Synaphobranchus kaupii]|uniref:Uncharacterized protein n=1 Tax=Synaphobranchus kaupii TaxID=118154 RepID=A0A9Q1FUC7_SYNKA|nr:hypothetical protein SKAU_G00080170 [Synaphobranchus kaupii]